MGAFLSFFQFSVVGAIEEGMIYALLTLGLFVSFRILNVADLTTEGSFTLGAAISVVLTLEGHPLLGVFVGMLGGALAGICTGFLQTKLRIQPILAGIIVMTGLYSVNLRIMSNKPTISLRKQETIFTVVRETMGKNEGNFLIIGIFVLSAMALLWLFLKTHTGLSLRATGDNPEMVQSSSINVNAITLLGLAIANALIALSGALLAQYQSSADITMGVGMVVVGLASLIVGEVIFRGRKSITLGILSALGGSVTYRILMAMVFYFNVSPSDQKIISAFIVIIAVFLPELYAKLKKPVKKGGDVC